MYIPGNRVHGNPDGLKPNGERCELFDGTAVPFDTPEKRNSGHSFDLVEMRFLQPGDECVGPGR